MMIASGKIATKAALNGIGQKPRYQFRNVFDVVISYGVKRASDPREVRSVKHQEPKIPHRNATDLSLIGGQACLARWRSQSSPASSLTLAAFAVSGASYQYSSSSGPISVSTLARNHARPSVIGATVSGVT